MDRKVFLALVAFAAFLSYLGLVVAILLPFVLPLVWAAIIGIATFPLYLRLRNWLGGRNLLCAVLMTAAVVLALVIPAALVAVYLTREATDLYQMMTSENGKLLLTLQQLQQQPMVQGVLDAARSYLQLLGLELEETLRLSARKFTGFLAAQSTAIVQNSFAFTFKLLLMLMALFFLYRDGEGLRDRLFTLLDFDTKDREELFARIKKILGAILYGVLLTCMVQGVLSGIGYWAAGLHAPVLFGVLAAFAALVPFVGTALVLIPAILYLLVQDQFLKAGLLLAWGVLIIGTSDNLIRPLFISGRGEISLLLVALGLLGGLAVFGPVGAVAGPVILSLLMPVLEIYHRQRS